MAANTVLNYLPRQSVVHKMTGTTKLAFFLLFTFASMITYNTWVLLGLMVISFSCFAVSHIKFKDVSFVFWFMVVFLALNNFFIFLFSPDQGTELYGTRVVLCHLFGPYDLTREQRQSLLRVLKHFPVEVSAPCPVTDAIVTSGGVKVGEVDPKTMESKLVKNLYFAGELLDTDAYTGGFNLQIAWATGRLAGQSAANEKE